MNNDTQASGLPTSSDFFNDFFNSEAEDRAVDQLKERGEEVYANQSKTEALESKIDKKIKQVRDLHPAGGVKAARFITTEILLEAPPNFFYDLEESVQKITTHTQGMLSEKGASELVGKAQENPFDEALKDEAFRVCQSIASTYLGNFNHRGIYRKLIMYMACMDIVGMSRIDPLWHDKEIDEIIINGPDDIQVERRGVLTKVPACRFASAEHLENLLERIFSTLGKSLTRTTPYLDGRLYDQSRIAATHRIISPAGPNVAIRRHPEKYWTVMDLIDYRAGSEEMFTEIGNLINKGCSYIVIGGTSSGKTSLLNALSGFWEPTQRVLTLEDNLELKLNPNKWIGAPMECVPANPNKRGDKGVSMRELVRACLRMRPDGIVVGEVRDGAMYDLCQALNTGHWGCSTVHANSPYDGIYRMQSLVTQAELIGPEQALPLIAAAFDFIIMQERFPQDGSRKITSVCEIDPYPSVGEDGRLHLGVKEIWKFDAVEGLVNDRVEGNWVKVGELSEHRRKNRHLDLTPDKTWEELRELCKI